MTALTVLTDVANEIGLKISDLRVSSADLAVKQIVRHVNATGLEIARRAEWSKLVKIATFEAGSEWKLPDDFFRLVERGAVWKIGDTFDPIRHVLSADTWAFISVNPSAQGYCHLAEGKLLFSPAITLPGVKIKYITDSWAGGKNKITQDGDQPVVPEELLTQGAVLRWRRQKGQEYADLVGEFEAAVLSEIKADRGAT